MIAERQWVKIIACVTEHVRVVLQKDSPYLTNCQIVHVTQSIKSNGVCDLYVICNNCYHNPASVNLQAINQHMNAVDIQHL